MVLDGDDCYEINCGLWVWLMGWPWIRRERFGGGASRDENNFSDIMWGRKKNFSGREELLKYKMKILF